MLKQVNVDLLNSKSKTHVYQSNKFVSFDLLARICTDLQHMHVYPIMVFRLRNIFVGANIILIPTPGLYSIPNLDILGFVVHVPNLD